MKAIAKSGHSKIAPKTAALTQATNEIKAAWEKVERYGLEFGAVCYKWREKFKVKGFRGDAKGEGITAIWQQCGIPERSAFRWIERYEIFIGLREPEPPREIEEGDAPKPRTLATVPESKDEWYTPENCIEAAREVLGRIDLDPASCARANTVVKAEKIYTKKQDGLTKKWAGKVWLNADFDIASKFVDKLLDEFKNGNVKEAILLVSLRSVDSSWFQPLFDYPMCFPSPRLKFWNENGVGEAPNHGCVLVYIGRNREQFAEVFKKFGAIVTQYKIQNG